MQTGNDDIVTMLRREYGHFNNDGVGDYEVITTAADEIERLREELEETIIDRDAWRNVNKLTWELMARHNE